MFVDLLERFKLILDYEASTVAEEEFLIECLKSAVVYVENYTHIIFEYKEIEELVLSLDSKHYFTKHGYIQEVKYILDEDLQVIDSSAIKVKPESNKVYHRGLLRPFYTIKYSVGWRSIDSVPEKYLTSVLQLAKKVYFDLKKDTDIYTAESITVREYTRTTDKLPNIVRDNLDRMRLVYL